MAFWSGHLDSAARCHCRVPLRVLLRNPGATFCNGTLQRHRHRQATSTLEAALLTAAPAVRVACALWSWPAGAAAGCLQSWRAGAAAGCGCRVLLPKGCLHLRNLGAATGYCCHSSSSVCAMKLGCWCRCKGWLRDV